LRPSEDTLSWLAPSAGEKFNPKPSPEIRAATQPHAPMNLMATSKQEEVKLTGERYSL